jgi:transposase InsO family protein
MTMVLACFSNAFAQAIRQARDAVLTWLLWYNRQRMHSTQNYLSPTEFESRWENAGSQAA